MKNKHISYGIAENGEEAVKQWEKGNYHLVLVRDDLATLLMCTDCPKDGYSNACHGWH
jgi:hypothetical protein